MNCATRRMIFGVWCLVFGVCGLPAASLTVNPSYTVTDFGLNTNSIRRVTLTPIAPAGDYTNAILVRRPLTPETYTNGVATFTNIVSGYAYQLTIESTFAPTRRTNFFPSTLSGDINGGDYLAWIAGFAADGSVLQWAWLNPTNLSTGLSLTNGNLYNATNRGVITLNGQAINSWDDVTNYFAQTGGGSASNVFFIDSATVTHDTAGGSNRFSVVGSALTGIPQSGVTDLAADLAAKAGTNSPTIYSPVLQGPFTAIGNSLFSMRTAQSGFTNYWTNSFVFERWETNVATSRPWTMTLMNRGEVAGGSDYQNEVSLNYVAGAPFSGSRHRRYDSFWIPDAASAIGWVRDWERGVNASSVFQYSETRINLHRMYWYPSSDFLAEGLNGQTMINSGSNGAVKINAYLDGNAWLGTGGLEVHSGGTNSSKVAGITGAGEGHFAGTIYQTNATGSRLAAYDANKGLNSVSTTGPILGTGEAAAASDVAGLWSGSGTFLTRFGTNASAGSGDAVLAADNIFTGTSNRFTGSVYINSLFTPTFYATNVNVQNLIATNVFPQITNAALVGTDANGKLVSVTNAVLRGQPSLPDFATIVGASGALFGVNSSGDIVVSAAMGWSGSTFTGSNNFFGYFTGNGSGLTNLDLTISTNGINTGVIPVGKVTYTNITGNITIAGFSGVDANGSDWAEMYVTNGSGPGTPRSVTFAASVGTSTNTFVLDRTFWVTNDIDIMVKVRPWRTNAAAVRWSP